MSCFKAHHTLADFCRKSADFLSEPDMSCLKAHHSRRYFVGRVPLFCWKSYDFLSELNVSCFKAHHTQADFYRQVLVNLTYAR